MVLWWQQQQQADFHEKRASVGFGGGGGGGGTLKGKMLVNNQGRIGKAPILSFVLGHLQWGG